ncbi:Alpha/Beta hydrolase protein [Zopfochytrium polystomum]|nr:Alpha/Beta hydrolase protein [Zopfochytrium polystomum]
MRSSECLENLSLARRSPCDHPVETTRRRFRPKALSAIYISMETRAPPPASSAQPPSEFCHDAVFELPSGDRIAASVWSSQRNSSATRILALTLRAADNAATWDVFLSAVFAVAPDAFEVVAFDLPGHGFSDHWPRPKGYSYAGYAEVAALVVDHLEWSSFAILSHSLGAEFGSLLAAAMPERVSHYIALEGLGPYRHPSTATDYLRRHLTHHRRVANPKTVFPTVESATTARMKGLFPLSEPAARTLIRRSIVSAPSLLSTASATAVSSPAPSGFIWSSDPLVFSLPRYLYSAECVADILGAIRAPTLTIWGNESRAMALYGIRDRVTAIKGDVTLVTMPGGHHLHLEPSTARLAVAETLLWLEKHGVRIPYSDGKAAKDVLLALISNSKEVTRVELADGSRVGPLDSFLAARL